MKALCVLLDAGRMPWTGGHPDKSGLPLHLFVLAAFCGQTISSNCKMLYGQDFGNEAVPVKRFWTSVIVRLQADLAAT